MAQKRIAALLLAALLSAVLSACAKENGDALTVTLLSVGKADAIVLQCSGQTMILDTGETDDGRKLLKYLDEQEIDRVDVLIITHFDKDHVGGAALLTEKMPPERVLLPDYESERPEYLSFLQALAAGGIEPERLQAAERFSLGGAEVLVEPPPAFLEDVGDNDRSLITTVCFGEKRLVFMGDSEKLRIRQWLNNSRPQSCDFLKLPHHGDYDKALPELLAVLRPRFAAICDSDKNPAEEKTLEALSELGVRVCRTAEGTVRIVCDGKSIRVEQ